MSSASPDSRRKPSWSASQWYIAIRWPGVRTKRLTPPGGSSSSTSSVPRPRGPTSHHSPSRTLRTYQLMRATLRAQAVEHDVEIAAPLAGRRRGERRAHDHLDVGRLHVAPHRTRPLGPRDELRTELLELRGA